METKAQNFKDLKGDKFGYWTVLGQSTRSIPSDNGHMLVGTSRSRAARWSCQCACGSIREVGGEKLRQGTSLSCGCSSAHDLAGKTFGTWKVIQRARNHFGALCWLCRCSETGWEVLFEIRHLCAENPPATPPIRADSPPDPDSRWQPVAKVGQTMLSKDGGKSWIVAVCSDDHKELYAIQSCDWCLVSEGGQSTIALPHPSTWIRKVAPKAEDLTGQTHGQWEAVRRVGTTCNRCALWECRCKGCGRIRKLTSFLFRHAQPCGCGKGAKTRKVRRPKIKKTAAAKPEPQKQAQGEVS